MPTFIIRLHDLEATAKPYAFSIDHAWLSGALAGTDLRSPEDVDGSVDVLAQKSGKDILVHGTVKAAVVVDCVRCLEDARIEVDTTLTSLFCPQEARAGKHAAKKGNDDTDEDDLSREPFTGEQFALDEVVRDQLVVEIPMQPLCREDCPGIEIPAHVRPPADFGQEAGPSAEQAGDQLDPRLSPLRQLAQQLKKKRTELAIWPE